MKALCLRAPAAALLVLGLGISAARAITYSLDIPSPSLGLFGPGSGGDSLHNPPPLGPVPPLIPGAPGPIEVDGFSYGVARPTSAIYFSVSRASVGAAGSAVFVQSTTLGGDQPADIFVTSLASPGTNALVYDGNGSSGPSLGLLEPMGAFPPGDNVDGLDLSLAPVVLGFGGAAVFWSVDPATAGIYGGGATAADIFGSPPVPGYAAGPAVYAPAGLIGLLAGDDIDGLAYMEDGLFGATPGDIIFFSLTPGSATLTALGYAPGTGGADVFVTSPGALVPTLFAPAAALGLLATDNIDALDLIPEPSQLTLLGLGALGCMIRRRRA